MNSPSSFAKIIETVAGASVPAVIAFALVVTVARLLLQLGNTRVTRWMGEFTDSLAWAAIVVFMLLRPFVVQTFNIPSQSMENTLLVGDYIVANKAIYRTRGPHDGEIVVFRGPTASLQDGQVPDKTYLIKRCIGTPGQVITIVKDRSEVPVLYRNGKAVAEPYAVHPTESSRAVMNFKIVDGRCMQYDGDSILLSPIDNNPLEIPSHGSAQDTPTDPAEIKRLLDAPPEAVPSGRYLMMGDNRPDSYDSRFWGFVGRDRIMARAEAVWLPISRIGRVH